VTTSRDVYDNPEKRRAGRVAFIWISFGEDRYERMEMLQVAAKVSRELLGTVAW
jgi:hypothetical protein